MKKSRSPSRVIMTSIVLWNSRKNIVGYKAMRFPKMACPIEVSLKTYVELNVLNMMKAKRTAESNFGWNIEWERPSSIMR